MTRSSIAPAWSLRVNSFVGLIDRLVTGVESMPLAAQPVCWFLAGAALLDIDQSGRKGVDLPKVRSTYWPHRINFERISRSDLDWRLLCPGPMVEQPALGVHRLRIALDTLPVQVPAFARALPGPLFLPVFAYMIPQMIVPYADAAAVMLANFNRGDTMARHRVGLALPLGMRGRSPSGRPNHGMRPNPRLQRTRWRAPLSRQPLGDSTQVQGRLESEATLHCPT